ncbi:signal transduction histidine kinase [Nitrosospira sp. Nsp5]|uniref:histidine kinase n=1 Tax=Nitrosospira multiformis TaxID=1231 RepID=A0ABY0TA13_9PROT|nr:MULTISPECIES: sensor histidine kinase [Nitrosospira]PTR08073.1 signal transduction histidine kinase [Nitrosospira sp. Nsp5]SDQ48310.1 Signal transduction histidine kinase [Nitrosospira multiformis]
MSTEDLTLDLLAYHAFPHLASALRLRQDAIVQAWEAAVVQTLPAADALTLQNLRNSIPLILQEIIDAFASDKPSVTRNLVEGSKMHGESRFQENYNIRELVVEYRLLRRVIIEQVTEAMDERLDMRSNIALNMAVDTALQSGVIRFIEHLQQQNRTSTEVQAKYLSFLSHDLRNHLHHAMLHVQLLVKRLTQVPEFADSVADLESVKRAILQTTAGMDRMLQSEQLRKEPVHHTAEPVDLKLLLSEITSQFAHEAKAKGIKLDSDVPDGAQAIGDEGLLTLVLQNLLGNAMKYSSEGEIKILARKDANSEEDIDWVLSVSDQGPGIAPENLSHLFDAFRRGDTYGQPGVGLGLAIASEATRLLGGKLEVQSKVGVGSTFRLMLPRKDQDQNVIQGNKP